MKHLKNRKEDTIVEANAGTGKTYLIVEEYIKILKEGTNPDEIALITFTEAAAGELKERVAKRLIEEMSHGNVSLKKPFLYLPSAPISTIHSFCLNLLKRFGFKYDYFNIDNELITDMEVEELLDMATFEVLSNYNEEKLRKIITSIDIDHISGFNSLRNSLKDAVKNRTRFSVFSENFSIESTVEKIKNIYYKLPNHYKLESFESNVIENLEKEKNLIKELTEILRKTYETYEKLKTRKEKIGYNDLLTLTFKMLNENENAREEIAQNFKHIIVDEFQDTDPFQWKIIKLLKNTKTPPKIFLVGDPKQSIYRFRSADISIWKDATNYINNKRFLTVNYRSGKNLLNFFNTAFEKLYNETEKYLGVELEFHEFEGKKEGGEVISIEYERGKIENFAEKAISETYETSLKEKVGIICRKRKDLEPFEKFLRKNNIKYTLIGNNFFETEGIKELFHLLKYLQNPEDTKSLFLLLTSRFCGLDHWQALSFIKKGTTETEKLDKLTKKFIAFTEKIRKLKDNELHSTLISKIVYETNFLDLLSAIDRESYFTVFELIKEVFEFEKKNYLSFNELIEHLEKSIRSKERKKEPLGGEENGFFLMTIHGSKGLQFDSVILAPWGRRKNPGRFLFTNIGFAFKLFSRNNDKKDEEKFKSSPFYTMLKDINSYLDYLEEKNLIYVAMTRAVNKLILGIEKQKQGPKFPYGKESNVLLPIAEKYKKEKNYLLKIEKTEKELPVIKVKNVKIPELITPSKINSEDFNYEKTGSTDKSGLTAFEYGTVVHALVEAFIKGHPPEKAIDFAISHSEEKSKSLNKKLERLYLLLNNKYLFLKNSDVEVDIKGFHKNNFVSGRIDILLKTEDGYEIWDIKTGKSEEEKIKIYKEQLNLYKELLENAGYKISKSILFFIDEDKIHEI